MKQLRSPQELDEYWLLSGTEIDFWTNVYSASRLAVALQLKYVEREGLFARPNGEIAALVIRFVASQLGGSLETLDTSDWGGRSTRRHRADAVRLKEHLVESFAPHESGRSAITEAALSCHSEQRTSHQRRHDWIERLLRRRASTQPRCLTASADRFRRMQERALYAARGQGGQPGVAQGIDFGYAA